MQQHHAGTGIVEELWQTGLCVACWLTLPSIQLFSLLHERFQDVHAPIALAVGFSSPLQGHCMTVVPVSHSVSETIQRKGQSGARN